MEEYKEWRKNLEEEEVPVEIEEAYRKALKYLEDLKPFEVDLVMRCWILFCNMQFIFGRFTEMYILSFLFYDAR